MQLKKLYIEDYKIFNKFTYEFPYDLKHFNNVIIGVNGSGKSTILEVIAEIFSNVELNKESSFAFELEYRIKQNFIDFPKDYKGMIPPPLLVKIFAEKEQIPEMLLSFNDGEEFALVPKMSQNTDFLPRSIVMYYAGHSKILKKISQPHIELISKQYREGIISKDSRFFYFQPEHFNIILLSLLSFEYGDVPTFLKEKAKISGVQSLTIRLKKPDWARDTIKNYWGARGEVKKFLDYLVANETTPEELINPEKSKKPDSIVIEAFQDEANIITIINQKRLFEIRDYLIEERKLFEIFNIMLNDGLLKDISFSLIKDDDKNKSFSILSEGEQQALTIKGLSELLAQENTLFLFDEPDTYLHPRWQRQFISEIEESIEQNATNEISYLIATHSPQILSNANPKKTFVKIIEDGQLIEKTPKHYGREISSILYNLMGVEERNEAIRNDLSNLFMLIEEEEVKEAESELKRLLEILGETDPDIKNAEIQIKYLKEDEADN